VIALALWNETWWIIYEANFDERIFKAIGFHSASWSWVEILSHALHFPIDIWELVHYAWNVETFVAFPSHHYVKNTKNKDEAGKMFQRFAIKLSCRCWEQWSEEEIFNHILKTTVLAAKCCWSVYFWWTCTYIYVFVRTSSQKLLVHESW
jgi:hypothetical protein